MEATFVIIGGGIAGVSCAETLAFLEPEQSIILITESSLIKTVTNLQSVTKILSKFDVQETEASAWTSQHSNINILYDCLSEIDPCMNILKTQSNKTIQYKYLCICTGAQPSIIPQATSIKEYVCGIRDTDSVETFLDKLSKSKKIVIVGNGGIASEIVYKIRKTEVHWVVKDKHITSTFVDPGAAQFLLNSLQSSQTDTPGPSKRMRYKEEAKYTSGAALGPDWYKYLEIFGANTNVLPFNIKVHYENEITNVIKCSDTKGYPIEVYLSSNEKIQCDLIVSATGVKSHVNFKVVNDLIQRRDDGGIEVNQYMQTSVENIYAAGDVCFPSWSFAKHWFPMKLWTQARQMGCYSAKSMSGAFNKEIVLQDFCFELFAHSTKLFGHQVILLGLYNGQTLGQDYEILLRMTKGHEYVKFVLQNHKLQGVILIGETGLEETCENLILNQIDLSPYGVDILNPDIDIEDYFD